MVFFVKQKTAYEMRISDWSSDVCSSDLPIAQHFYRRAGGPLFFAQHIGAVGIEGNVLRRRQKGHQHRQGRKQAQMAAGGKQAHAGDSRRQQNLSKKYPTASTSQNGRRVPVDQRRPTKPERRRRSEQSKHTNVLRPKK